VHRIAADTIDDERAACMVSLLMTDLKPAPWARRGCGLDLGHEKRRRH
jgi:hypothetical protein